MKGRQASIEWPVDQLFEELIIIYGSLTREEAAERWKQLHQQNTQAQIPAPKKLKKMSMYEKILVHQYNDNSIDLASFIKGPVPFKIVVTDPENVDQYPEVFELGKPDYDYSIDTFMKHMLMGDSEQTTLIQDSNWIFVLQAMLTGSNDITQVLLNKRPNSVIMFRQAHVLKSEAKSDLNKMLEADKSCDLTVKFAEQAYLTFPKNRSVIGVLSCPQYIHLKEITYEHSSQQYKEDTLASFSLATEKNRVDCIKAIFNVARYLISVTGPLDNFHLVPNISVETVNGHTVVWEREGLRKTLKATHKNEALLKHIYDNKLPNVEWGTVEGPNTILITRIGQKLCFALIKRLITVEKAIEGIKAGVAQIHEKGVAHTDLKMDNVFVKSGVAFLDDLEYITEISTIMNKPYRVLSSVDQPDTMTASELDLKQLGKLVREIEAFRY